MKEKILNRTTFFIIVILLAIFLTRWITIKTIPNGLEGDETAWIASALFLQHNLQPTNREIWGVHVANANNFPVSIKIIQYSFLIFGKDILSARKILVVLSSISFLFFYLFIRKFLSIATSLIVTLLYSFSTYQMLTSSLALPGMYTAPFIYLSMIVLFAISKRNTFQSCLAAFSSGLTVTLALLTYNLAYLLPLMALLLLVIIAKTESMDWIRTSFITILFLIPLILTIPTISKTLTYEIQTKSFAFGTSLHNINDLKEKKLNINSLGKNVHTIYNLFFDRLRYETADMFASYPAPLINKIVTVACILGLSIALIYIRKYYFLVIWFACQIIIFHIVLGLNFPRMWLITIGLIYILAGVAIDTVFTASRKLTLLLRLPIWFVIIVIYGYIIINDLTIFYRQAVYSSAYSNWFREMTEIIKKYPLALGRNLFIISPYENKMPSANILTSFYYLANNPWKVSELEGTPRNKLGIYQESEFLKLGTESNSFKLSQPTIFILDKDTTPSVLKYIEQTTRCTYSMLQHNYFYELIPKDCTRPI